MDRRNFLKGALAVGAVAALPALRSTSMVCPNAEA